MAATVGDVKTKLNYASYLSPSSSGPLFHIQTPTLTNPPTFQKNYTFEERDVTIHDLRGQQDPFNLDTNGFQFSPHSTSADLNNYDSIQKVYYPEIKDLVSKITGVDLDNIKPLSCTIRDSSKDPLPVAGAPEGVLTGPWNAVHVDRELEDVRINDAANTTKRVRHLSVWRPIGQKVQYEPLAVADGRTSPPGSGLSSLLICVDKVTCTGLLYPTSLFDSGSYTDQWYYLSEQIPSEVLIIKNCDSQPPQGGAKLCLHSSFGAPTAGVSRRSISVNLVVIG